MRRLLLAFMMLCVMAACSLMISGCPPERLVTTNQEVEIGREASRQIEQRYPVDRDPRRNALVNQIGRDLVRYSERQDITYTFRILDVDGINAVSLPGGWIYVYRGLIDYTAADRNQLAGVIAHEIGHVAARHHADLIGRQTYAQIIVGTLTGGDVSRIATIFANLELLRWSRQHEFEADRLGINYTYQSAYQGEGLIRFLQRLVEAQRREPTRFEEIFRTHPVTTERVRRAEEHLADLRADRASP